MKLLAVILKDLSQSFRSYFALAFMFGVPILITGMFYFMFGGIRGEENGFEIPKTSLLIVNLDRGMSGNEGASSFRIATSLSQTGIDTRNATTMGEILVNTLKSEALADLLSVALAGSEAQARQAVERGEVDVAVIIPPNFTQAVMEPGESASLELYQDPTLTLEPGIAKSILDQFVQGISGAKIGIEVTLTQLGEKGLVIDNELTQEVISAFIAPLQNQTNRESSLLRVSTPKSAATDNSDAFTRILRLIMGGMMVFYAFFTGAASAQSILTEEEKGTLPRLFTTPTATTIILSGKFLAVLLILLVQVSVLLIFSRLVFGIHWGAPLGVVLVAAALILLATTCGLFIISFLKNSRQAGVVFGGVLTFTGMIGIFTVFTAGTSTTPQIFEQVSLIVPQGWAMRSLRLVMEGAPLSTTLIFLVGQLVWSTAFFLVGLFRLRKRFE